MDANLFDDEQPLLFDALDDDESERVRLTNDQRVYALLGGPFCAYERWYRKRDSLAVYYGCTDDARRRHYHHQRGTEGTGIYEDKQTGWKLVCIEHHWFDTMDDAMNKEWELWSRHFGRHGEDVHMRNQKQPSRPKPPPQSVPQKML